MVARIGKLPAGTYYVNATAELNVATGDGEGICWIAKGSAPNTELNEGAAAQEGTSTVAETAAVRVTAGDTLEEECVTSGNNGSFASDAGILAIRVLASSHQ